jgi:hypothetical protein
MSFYRRRSRYSGRTQTLSGAGAGGIEPAELGEVGSRMDDDPGLGEEVDQGTEDGEGGRAAARQAA